MHTDKLKQRGILLLGCGKMGSALLAGWLKTGLSPEAVWVLDPKPSEWLTSLEGLHLNQGVPDAPAIVLVAVKPQMIGDALPALISLGNSDVLFVSIAAGASLATFETMLGAETAIIRTMPNTPAAVGRGVTALIGNAHVSEDDLALAEGLLASVGQTVRLTDESQMDAVTAVSGSGPAYVFHLIETLAAAGEAEGLPADLALTLAKATVGGAGALAEQAQDDPSQLRVNVTSPGGTTQAALEVLMDQDAGLPPLMTRAVAAAAKRSRELAG